MNNHKYLIALHLIDGLGPLRLKMLIDRYKDPQTIWQTSISDLISAGLPPNLSAKIVQQRKLIDPEAEFEKIQKLHIKTMAIFDDQYPQLLKEIYNPPVLLYYLGTWPDLTKTIGVVGTRQPTSYGRAVSKLLTSQLVKAGFVVVSGLARGIDTIAHQTVVDNQGQTIAVLGSGLNQVFPIENRTLANQIVSAGGLVISEYHPNIPALPGHFPARNRIIAGLSQSILITEAAKGSGSLITAKIALEENRLIFAVPGPITSAQSQGNHELIRQGAILVSEIEDIFVELGQTSQLKILSTSQLTDLETEIIAVLGQDACHVDELSRLLNQPVSTLSANLLRLEIAGFIYNQGNNVYIKNI